MWQLRTTTEEQGEGKSALQDQASAPFNIFSSIPPCSRLLLPFCHMLPSVFSLLTRKSPAFFFALKTVVKQSNAFYADFNFIMRKLA